MSKLGICLAVMMVMCMIASPVSAASYTLTGVPILYKDKIDVNYQGVSEVTHDASETGRKIALIQFTIPSESTVSFTLYYGNDSTVSGSSENHHVDLTRTSSTVTLGGDSMTYTYIDTQPFYDFNLAGYARDADNSSRNGFLIYSLNYGALDNNLAAFYEVANPGQNTIYKITATGTKNFDMYITDANPADVSAGASKSIVDVIADWINFAIGIAFLVYDVVTGLFYWLKFFFVDNLGMTIALYLSISMAYSASTSKNIFQFFKKFFSDQRKLFEFILGLWRLLVEVVATFRGIFRI